MSRTYRDDRDAALSRAESLQRENHQLRSENTWLLAQFDPPGDHPDQTLAHYRGAAVGVLLLLGLIASAGLIARDTEASVKRLTEDVFAQETRAASFTDDDARMALGTALPEAPAPPAATPPTTPPELRPEPEVIAVTPLLHGCFTGPLRRVDLLAFVDPRGRVRRADVFAPGSDARVLRSERRCVRRAFASTALPTSRSDSTSYGPNAELHLVVFPAPQGRHNRRAR